MNVRSLRGYVAVGCAAAVVAGCTAQALTASRTTALARPAGASAGHGRHLPSAGGLPDGPHTRHTTRWLAAGSDPRVLPGPILVADEDNNRLIEIDPSGRVLWRFPQRGDLRPGESFLLPDDVFGSADGKRLIVTEEEDSVISLLDIASRRIVYRYGVPGDPGMGPDRVHNPDDALLLPGGGILTADIMNCRLLLIRPPAHTASRIYGQSRHDCRHDPPARYGSPNGAFPLRNGRLLVTEINGDWVDEVSLAGRVFWSMHPPGIAYPSDTNEIRPGRYLTVDYSTPGQLLIFDRSGRAIWRYRPIGAAVLNHPSIAVPLPNGDVLATDDYNNRVIVVDPRTNRVVWQYGHTGRPGRAPGYLDNPDGVDLTGSHALLADYADAMRNRH